MGKESIKTAQLTLLALRLEDISTPLFSREISVATMEAAVSDLANEFMC